MFNCKTSHKLLVFLISLWASFSAALQVAHGCAFHMVLPQKSIGDRLLESSEVMFAREDPKRPFFLKQTHVLKGSGRVGQIPLFLDSSTRRKLAVEPGDALLIARSAQDGSWHRLAYVSKDERELFVQMVAQSATWAKSDGETARFRFFARLHDHPDPAIWLIALSELDRTGYRNLRTMDVRLPARHIRTRLLIFTERAWAPVRIMMLGVLADQDSRAIIAAQITAATKSTFVGDLPSWATALIEAEREQGIARLKSAFLQRSDRPFGQADAVLKAFALHLSEGDPKLAPAIRKAVDDAVQNRPNLAKYAMRNAIFPKSKE